MELKKQSTRSSNDKNKPNEVPRNLKMNKEESLIIIQGMVHYLGEKELN